MEKRAFKIALVGPESSGKSTLAKKLGHFFDARIVTEFARTYLTDNNTSYKQSDLIYFAQQQLFLEQKIEHSEEILICDTNPLSILVWSKLKFGHVDEEIERLVNASDYDLHLLLFPDLPYEEDPLREDSPLSSRIQIFKAFEREMKNRNLKYLIIRGAGPIRLKNALSAISKEINL